MMFGLISKKKHEREISEFCDILDAKEDDLYSLVMEPESEEAEKVRRTYTIFFNGMNEMKKAFKSGRY